MYNASMYTFDQRKFKVIKMYAVVIPPCKKNSSKK